MGWNIKYRNTDKVITTAGYIALVDLEEEGYTATGEFDGPIPTLLGFDPPPIPKYLKKFNETTRQIEDNT